MAAADSIVVLRHGPANGERVRAPWHVQEVVIALQPPVVYRVAEQAADGLWIFEYEKGDKA